MLEEDLITCQQLHGNNTKLPVRVSQGTSRLPRYSQPEFASFKHIDKDFIHE